MVVLLVSLSREQRAHNTGSADEEGHRFTPATISVRSSTLAGNEEYSIFKEFCRNLGDKRNMLI